MRTDFFTIFLWFAPVHFLEFFDSFALHLWQFGWVMILPPLFLYPMRSATAYVVIAVAPHRLHTSNVCSGITAPMFSCLLRFMFRIDGIWRFHSLPFGALVKPHSICNTLSNSKTLPCGVFSFADTTTVFLSRIPTRRCFMRSGPSLKTKDLSYSHASENICHGACPPWTGASCGGGTTFVTIYLGTWRLIEEQRALSTFFAPFHEMIRSYDRNHEKNKWYDNQVSQVV